MGSHKKRYSRQSEKDACQSEKDACQSEKDACQDEKYAIKTNSKSLTAFVTNMGKMSFDADDVANRWVEYVE